MTNPACHTIILPRHFKTFGVGALALGSLKILRKGGVVASDVSQDIGDDNFTWESVSVVIPTKYTTYGL